MYMQSNFSNLREKIRIKKRLEEAAAAGAGALGDITNNANVVNPEGEERREALEGSSEEELSEDEHL